MEEKKNQAEETGEPFSRFFSRIDPARGITAFDYLDALDCHVKVPLQRAFWELCESINDLPRGEMERASDFLTIQRTAFMLWEQMDKKVMEDHKARRKAEGLETA